MDIIKDIVDAEARAEEMISKYSSNIRRGINKKAENSAFFMNTLTK